MSDHSSADPLGASATRSEDPLGELLERASEEGRYELHEGEAVDPDTLPTSPEEEEPARGRPPRRRKPAQHVVTVRLTAEEARLLDAASERNRSAFIRRALVSLSESIVEAPWTTPERRRRIRAALAELERAL